MPKATEKKTATIAPSSPPPAALGQADDGSGVIVVHFFPGYLSAGWLLLRPLVVSLP